MFRAYYDFDEKILAYNPEAEENLLTRKAEEGKPADQRRRKCLLTRRGVEEGVRYKYYPKPNEYFSKFFFLFIHTPPLSTLTSTLLLDTSGESGGDELGDMSAGLGR